MSIKSKRWYENQIKVLENAVKNMARFIESCDWTTDPIKMSEIGKRNSPYQAECKKIYSKLNQLKDEYWLYYK